MTIVHAVAADTVNGAHIFLQYHGYSRHIPFPPQNELSERRKALEEEEKALDTRYKTAAANLDAENKAARAEVAKARKALAREKGELASKARNSAAEAEVAARKVRCWCFSRGLHIRLLSLVPVMERRLDRCSGRSCVASRALRDQCFQPSHGIL